MAVRALVCVCVSLLISPAAWALTINLNMGANLLADPGAVTDFDNAAHLWESIFSDPVTVNIDADLTPTLPSFEIGGASPVYELADFNSVISHLKSDADPDDGILAALPDVSQFHAFGPLGFSLSTDMRPTKANMKAMGFTGLDGLYGASDGRIDFNSNFSYDYDPSNGIDADKMDFTATAIHEIGHVLGFYSSERVIDADLYNNTTGTINLAPLDLFRFASNAAPSDDAQFTSFLRDLYPPDSQVFSDTANVWAMSTGTYYGDGEDPSHWLDDNGDPARFIGIMDPTADFGEGYDHITYADIRALDLIGWDYTVRAVPEPSTFALFGIAFAGLGFGSRKRRLTFPLQRRSVQRRSDNAAPCRPRIARVRADDRSESGRGAPLSFGGAMLAKRILGKAAVWAVVIGVLGGACDSALAHRISYTDYIGDVSVDIGGTAYNCTSFSDLNCAFITITAVGDTNNITAFSVPGASGLENSLQSAAIHIVFSSGQNAFDADLDVASAQLFVSVDQTNGGAGFGSKYGPTYPLATYGSNAGFGTYDLASDFDAAGFGPFCPDPDLCHNGQPILTTGGTALTISYPFTFPMYSAFSSTLLPDITVPEPATLALFGVGLAGLGVSRRRRVPN